MDDLVRAESRLEDFPLLAAARVRLGLRLVVACYVWARLDSRYCFFEMGEDSIYFSSILLSDCHRVDCPCEVLSGEDVFIKVTDSFHFCPFLSGGIFNCLLVPHPLINFELSLRIVLPLNCLLIFKK